MAPDSSLRAVPYAIAAPFVYGAVMMAWMAVTNTLGSIIPALGVPLGFVTVAGYAAAFFVPFLLVPKKHDPDMLIRSALFFVCPLLAIPTLVSWF